MDRRVTPPKRVTSSIWDTPPPCKQALSVVIWTKDDRVLIIQQILYNPIHGSRYLNALKDWTRGFSGGKQVKKLAIARIYSRQ